MPRSNWLKATNALVENNQPRAGMEGVESELSGSAFRFRSIKRIASSRQDVCVSGRAAFQTEFNKTFALFLGTPGAGVIHPLSSSSPPHSQSAELPFARGIVWKTVAQ